MGIWIHLSNLRHIQLVFLFVVMLASGLAELVSHGAVVPFLAVLSEPERLWQQPLVQDLANRAGLEILNSLLLTVTFGFAVAALVAATVRLANLWLNGKLVAAACSDLSCEAYQKIYIYPIPFMSNATAPQSSRTPPLRFPTQYLAYMPCFSF